MAISEKNDNCDILAQHSIHRDEYYLTRIDRSSRFIRNKRKKFSSRKKDYDYKRRRKKKYNSTPNATISRRKTTMHSAFNS